MKNTMEKIEQLVEQTDRVNEATGHKIIISIPLPHRDGYADCEVVVGKRPTRFQPWVAWLCFDGKNYAYGDYCQTYFGALECALIKLRREMETYRGGMNDE